LNIGVELGASSDPLTVEPATSIVEEDFHFTAILREEVLECQMPNENLDIAHSEVRFG